MLVRRKTPPAPWPFQRDSEPRPHRQERTHCDRHEQKTLTTERQRGASRSSGQGGSEDRKWRKTVSEHRGQSWKHKAAADGALPGAGSPSQPKRRQLRGTQRTLPPCAGFGLLLICYNLYAEVARPGAAMSSRSMERMTHPRENGCSQYGLAVVCIRTTHNTKVFACNAIS